MKVNNWTSANAVRVRGFGLHWLGEGKQLHLCKCCGCQEFRVDLRDTLAG